MNISFDDGFFDIYKYAFPLFKKYNILFTIYLTTNFPEKKADIWWIQLEKSCQNSNEIFNNHMHEIFSAKENIRDKMHSLTNTSPDFELTKSLCLSWENIEEMIASGLCTIGSHTVSHPSLTKISLDDVKRELLESKKLIEEKLNVKVEHFSYPHSMQNENIQKVLIECCYSSATLGYGGSIRKGSNPFLLNRKYIVED